MAALQYGAARRAIRLVVSDLAGTTVDFGSMAPAGVFADLFERHGVTLSAAEARGPMGMHKRDHIATLLADADIARRWTEAHGGPATEADIDALYDEFIPLQVESLPGYCDLIPGVVECVAWLREHGVPVATTTGYNREMTGIVLEGMKRRSFVPDLAICGSDVPAGRPAPWMIFRAMEELRICPPSAVAVIGDTLADVRSGVNAGAWTVGVTRTGNMLGLTEAQVEQLDEGALCELLAQAEEEMLTAGADAVLESFADLPSLLEDADGALVVRDGV